MVSLKFFIDIKSFRSHYGPGVDSASNRNEYQEHFLGSKGGRCARLTTLPLSCAFVTKSGNLNLLETSGHLGAVMGLIYLYLLSYQINYWHRKQPTDFRTCFSSIRTKQPLTPTNTLSWWSGGQTRPLNTHNLWNSRSIRLFVLLYSLPRYASGFPTRVHFKVDSNFYVHLCPCRPS